MRSYCGSLIFGVRIVVATLVLALPQAPASIAQTRQATAKASAPIDLSRTALARYMVWGV